LSGSDNDADNIDEIIHCFAAAYLRVFSSPVRCVSLCVSTDCCQ